MGAIDLDLTAPAAEWRETWEARALCAAVRHDEVAAIPVDKVGMCVVSVIAHRLPIEKMQFLLRVCGFHGTGKPMLTTAAKIAKTGQVMADLLTRDRGIFKNQALFRNIKQMEGAFRRFADALRLSDADRIALFEAVVAWVVCDYRIDPTMDRRDPDARRLTVN